MGYHVTPLHRLFPDDRLPSSTWAHIGEVDLLMLFHVNPLNKMYRDIGNDVKPYFSSTSLSHVRKKRLLTFCEGY
jgi:hypothetical protein